MLRFLFVDYYMPVLKRHYLFKLPSVLKKAHVLTGFMNNSLSRPPIFVISKYLLAEFSGGAKDS